MTEAQAVAQLAEVLARRVGVPTVELAAVLARVVAYVGDQDRLKAWLAGA